MALAYKLHIQDGGDNTAPINYFIYLFEFMFLQSEQRAHSSKTASTGVQGQNIYIMPC